MLIFSQAITARAAQLNCTVLSCLSNVILCHRGDDTYITWRVSVTDGKADFISGCYDMSLEAARRNVIARAWGDL